MTKCKALTELAVKWLMKLEMTADRAYDYIHTLGLLTMTNRAVVKTNDN